MGAEPAPSGGVPHAPVLYHEVLAALQPGPSGRYVDGTIGAGGHAAGLLEASNPDGQLLGLDLDPAALEISAQRLARFGDRLHLRQASFTRVREAIASLGWEGADGILLDLGLSSMQLEDATRGFSFQLEGPLDMRFNPAAATSASDLVNGLDEGALREILQEYGEEPQARRIARAIVRARPIRTTSHLVEVVNAAIGRRKRRIHPATRTFQALRIAVNDELEALRSGLGEALGALSPGGRLAVISFHSLEDRLVKRFLRRESQDCICPPDLAVCACGHKARVAVLTKRPIRPGEEELSQNPRARSAKLRVGEKLEQV